MSLSLGMMPGIGAANRQLYAAVIGGLACAFVIGKALPVVTERMRLFLERNFYDPSTPVPTDTLSR